MLLLRLARWYVARHDAGVTHADVAPAAYMATPAVRIWPPTPELAERTALAPIGDDDAPDNTAGAVVEPAYVAEAPAGGGSLVDMEHVRAARASQGLA